MLSILRNIMIFSVFITKIGNCLYCYECSTNVEFGSHDTCTSGTAWYLRRVQCRVPSVCATYSYTTLHQNLPSITRVDRGCQAIQYGDTCEDIFNDLRARGAFNHGHHKCSTCSTDYCNSSKSIKLSFYIVLFCIFISFITRCMS